MKISSTNCFMNVNQPGLIDFDVIGNSGRGRHGITLKPKVSTGVKGNRLTGMVDDKYIQIRVETIMSKLKYGKKLSSVEMKFLKEHAPHSYRVAVRVSRERESFRQELKMYRTKQQAERAYAMKISSYIRTLKTSAMAKAYEGSVDENGEMEVMQMKLMAIMDEYRKFKASAEYKKLKDEEKENNKMLSVNRAVSTISRQFPKPRVAKFTGTFIFYA